ncbi:MAG: hypothetical protein AABX13_05995 [Nanoarchaeota archaeon]
MRTFRSYCERQGWKMSTVVERVLKKELAKGTETEKGEKNRKEV